MASRSCFTAKRAITLMTHIQMVNCKAKNKQKNVAIFSIKGTSSTHTTHIVCNTRSTQISNAQGFFCDVFCLVKMHLSLEFKLTMSTTTTAGHMPMIKYSTISSHLYLRNKAHVYNNIIIITTGTYRVLSESQSTLQIKEKTQCTNIHNYTINSIKAYKTYEN